MFFFRMIKGAYIRQWKKMLIIAVTIALGASIATAMLNVMLDVGDKINQELKAYGANITVVSKSASVLNNLYEIEDDGSVEVDEMIKENDVGKLKTIFWAFNITDFAPTVETSVTVGGEKHKVVGTWFNHTLKLVTGETVITGVTNLRSWWEIKSGRWIDEQASENLDVAMIGKSFAEKQNLKVGDKIDVSGRVVDGETKTVSLKVVGIFEAGDESDDGIYAPLEKVQYLSGTENYVQKIEVSALTTPDNELALKAAKDVNSLSIAEYELWYCTAYVSSICYQIQEAIPYTVASAFRQIAESEGDILDKTQLLMTLITIMSMIGAALGISNLVTSSVMERSGEIGLMKAVGAKNSQIIILILTEIFITAIIGAVGGYFMGFGFAQIIGHTVFGSSIEMNGMVAFIVAVIILAVTLVGSFPAIRLMLRLRPSEVLHGR